MEGRTLTLAILGLMLLIMGLILPSFVNSIGGSTSTINLDEFQSDIDSSQSNVGGDITQSTLTFDTIDTLTEVFQMFFWSYGLPTWLNLIILVFLRIPFIYLLLDTLWPG
jgi:hypothetical protein